MHFIYNNNLSRENHNNLFEANIELSHQIWSIYDLHNENYIIIYTQKNK